MTRDEVEQFVQAVNRVLPDDMELCIEILDMRRKVVHLRMDRTEGVPSALQLSFETMGGLVQNVRAAAVYLTKTSG